MQNFFKDKSILVTGSCGSVGQELVRQLVHDFNAKEVTGIDNNESALFFQEQQFSQYDNTRFFPGGCAR